MVEFNILKFSDDMTQLLIDCELEDTGTGEENEGYFISAIYVEYYRNRTATGAPSGKAYLIPDLDENVTSYSGCVPSTVFNNLENGVNRFDAGLFYVIVECTMYDAGDSSHEYPHVTDEFGAVLDWKCVYRIGMNQIAAYLTQDLNKCDVSPYSQHFAIVWHSLQLAIEARDLDMLDRLWSRFVGFSSGESDTCNCR